MKRLTLLLTTAVVLAGCATTTSPTGRRQATGAVSQAQLNQMGAQAFAEAVVRAYGDRGLWEQLAANGLQNVARHFSADAAREVVRRVFFN